MFSRKYLWLVWCLGTACLAYGIAVSQPCYAFSRALSPASARIEFPSRIDLGTHEIGEVVIERFKIINRGDAELFIDEIQARTCSCTGIEREKEGKIVRVSSLKVAPHAETELMLRISVPDSIGKEAANTIQFRTNDPNQPSCVITAVVRHIHGGAICSPSTVSVGAILLGTKSQHYIDIRDKDQTPRSIQGVSVTCTPSDRVTLRLLRQNEFGSIPTQSAKDGTLIGRLEVNINTDTPGDLTGAIQIYLQGREMKPNVVRIYGRVAPSYDFFPAVLSLPRQSVEGPVYRVNCTCRNGRGEKFALKAIDLPSYLQVDISDHEQSGTRKIQILWHPDKGRPAKGQERQVIRFQAKSSNDEHHLEMPILLHN